jgi:hypothetical protein
MASISLHTGWINLLADLSQYWSFPSMSGLQSQPIVNVTSRRFAAGNYRMIVQKGRQSSLAVSFAGLSSAERMILEFELPGQALCFRDDRGRKVYGFYANPQFTEHQYDDGCDASLTVQELTYSEAVVV